MPWFLQLDSWAFVFFEVDDRLDGGGRHRPFFIVCFCGMYPITTASCPPHHHHRID